MTMVLMMTLIVMAMVMNIFLMFVLAAHHRDVYGDATIGILAQAAWWE
jgi:hypothetical protein